MSVSEVRSPLPDPTAVLDALDSAVAILDLAAARVLYANPAFRRLTGESADSAKDALAGWAGEWEAFDSQNRHLPFHAWPIQDLLRGEEMRDVELTSRNRRTGREFSAIWSGRWLRDPDGNKQAVLLSATEITNRKAAERALRQSEERYRQLFEMESDALILLDAESGALIAANAAATELYGYTREELLSLNQLDLTLEPEQTRAARLARQPFTALRWHRRKSGERMCVEISSRMVELDGRIASIAAIRDVTEQRRLVEALNKSEERFRKIFRTSPILMCTSRLSDGMIFEVNDEFQRVTGYGTGEASGRTLVDLNLLSAEQSELTADLIRAEGVIRDAEMELRTKAGDVRTILHSAEPVEFDGETVLVSSMIDVTEQRSAGEQARSLAVAVEQVGEAVVITDRSGNIRYSNPAFETITGYRSEEVRNQHTRILKSGVHTAEFYQAMWNEILAGRTWKGRMTNRRKDGSLYEEDTTISPIRSADGIISGFVAMKRDVTAQIHLERQLAQAQKMESVGRLAGGVAHDFNNLLTVINGYSELLAAALPEAPLHLYATEIGKAGERAASLTRQLLAFSRKQIFQLKFLDLDALIRDSENMLRRLIGEDIRLRAELGLDDGCILADSGQIHQVVMNLVVNARDAMPKGGLIQISTSRVRIDELQATASPDAKPGDWFLLSVKDTGIGMDAETKQRVFEPFFTSKKDDKGTGLGLSTVYGVVTQMGGWIDIVTSPDAGTTFHVYLPPGDGRETG